MSSYRYSNSRPAKSCRAATDSPYAPDPGHLQWTVLYINALPLLLGRAQKLLTYNTVQTTPLIVVFLLVAEWECVRALAGQERFERDIKYDFWKSNNMPVGYMRGQFLGRLKVKL